MSSFAALMALSATQTRQAEAAVQSALVERQRRETQRRKEQEERERKERELEAKLRLKRFDEEKKEQERQQRQEQELAAKERKLQQREEQERDRLRYGPKKPPARMDSSGYPVSNAALRHSRTSDDESSNALTREEKRKRRQDAELRYGVSASRRVGHSSGYGKAGRRLPGGAVDITATTSNTTASDPGSSLSVRQRLAAEPAMLIRLNVNKRDTRTIDEIMQDRAKAKAGAVLQGEQAKEFNDWFGKSKQKDAVRLTSSQTGSASTSRANTPATSSQPLSKAASGSASPAPRPFSQSKPFATPAKPAASQRTTMAKATPYKSAPCGFMKSQASFSKTPAVSSKLAASTSRPVVKKRPRSPSRSPSPPPKKRAMSSGPSQNDISQEIWKLFGKDRSRYVAADVMSDDEDMEADARDLEREELRSSRIARKEEELALEEERRHEEEKRRKRKERDRDVRERKGL